MEGYGNQPSEALAKPSSDLSEITVSPCSEVPRVPRFDVLEMSVLGIDQQACGHRKGGVLCLLGQPAKTERATDSNRPAEDLGGKFADARQLRGAAAENHSRLGLRRKGRIRKPIPNHFKNLLDAVPDDVCDRRTGYDLRNIPLIAGRGDGHQLTRVGPAGTPSSSNVPSGLVSAALESGSPWILQSSNVARVLSM